MPLAVRGATLFSRAAALALVLPPPRLTTRASAAMLCLPRGGGDDQPGEEWAPDASGASSLTKGTVYIVGTPIGNLDDLTLRAARTLREVDVVASEDTRRTAVLLRHLGASPKKQLSHHEHNARAASARVVELARGGATVAVVSDAGTPGISDPGALLAAECAAAGVPLVPVPGACAAIAALSISGFAAAGFRFGGFLPRGARGGRESGGAVRVPAPGGRDAAGAGRQGGGRAALPRRARADQAAPRRRRAAPCPSSRRGTRRRRTRRASCAASSRSC